MCGFRESSVSCSHDFLFEFYYGERQYSSGGGRMQMLQFRDLELCGERERLGIRPVNISICVDSWGYKFSSMRLIVGLYISFCFLAVGGTMVVGRFSSFPARNIISASAPELTWLTSLPNCKR